MSLRSRVALASMAATVVVVVLVGVVLLALTQRAQRDELDQALERHTAQVVAPATLASVLGGQRLPRDPRAIRPDLFVATRVVSINGAVLFESADFPSIDPPSAAGFTTASADGESWRVLSVELPGRQGQEVGLLQVTASMAGVNSTLAGLRRLLVGLGLAAVVGSGIGGWLLGTVAIRPLAGLRREAERVSETADLSVRVPVDQGPSEVDELAHALNAMLGRIEEGAHETQAALDASRGFAGNVAHELRTPLTSMQTNLEVLAANPDLPVQERNAIVADVSVQQRRLLEAFEALRLLARGELAAADLFEPTNLGDLIDGTVAQAQSRFPEATITLDVRREPPEARVWPEGIRVLLDNLIRNAVTYGVRPDGGAAEVEVSLDHDDGSWVLAVSDRGPGIPAEDRERVFGRFERGSAVNGAGTGLGLALVRQQAEVHGGRVAIEEAPGGGARVVVRAPLDGARPARETVG